MNIDGVNHQVPKIQLATAFEDKKQEARDSTGLIPSAIDASEKILSHAADVSTETEVHVDIDA
jgi:hypothetical protein